MENMVYAVIKVSNGSYAIHAEGMTADGRHGNVIAM